MCGIVGYIGSKNVTEILMDGLTRLEYRGYDSAGVAVLENGKINVVKAQGRLQALREKLEKNPAQPEHILTKWGVGYYFKY